MRSSDAHSRRSGRSGGSHIMYDARGNRVKSDALSNKYIRVLLFYILPYLVINGIILILVCSSPQITVDVKDTNDYVSTQVNFTVKSLLPIKELNVSLESEPLEYEKNGKTYTCTLDKNGTLTVDAKSINGMTRSVYTDINQMDDASPSIDEASINYSRGELSFVITDTLSGVDYDEVYGTLKDGEKVLPQSYDAATGSVTMLLPKAADSIDLHYEDMVGNAGTAKISLSAAGAVSENETTEEGNDASAAATSDAAASTESTAAAG